MKHINKLTALSALLLVGQVTKGEEGVDYLRESSVAQLSRSLSARAQIDMPGANLSGADLFGRDLSNANLSGADVSGAKLNGANLSNANLSNADLNGAQLRTVDALGTNFAGANLRGADVFAADLTGANFANADLQDIRNLREVSSVRGANFVGVRNLSQDDIQFLATQGAKTDLTDSVERIVRSRSRWR